MLGLTAVQEFVTRGRGTPVPFDPPKRLVTAGPYAYVGNPMQRRRVMLVVLLGLVMRSLDRGAGVMAHVYSAGLAGWDEGQDLRDAFGDRWIAYRAACASLAASAPSWHPPTMRLRAAVRGGELRHVPRSRGLVRRSATRGNSRVVPAESHPSGSLTRITYEPGNRYRRSTGVEAVTRALEHIHLGWALVGCVLRLPGISWFAQLVTDASGGEPRKIPRNRSNAMKIVIPGGSGHVGTVLARAFHRDGHEVVVLSRRPVAAPWRVISWDGVTIGDWSKDLDGCDVVINLAGRSVNCRYDGGESQRPSSIPGSCRRRSWDRRSHSPGVRRASGCRPARRRSIRIGTTRRTTRRLACSAASERDAPDTWKFSVDVARAWELAFDQSAVPSRKVKLRSAITMSPGAGGPFDALLGLVRCGLGGSAGDGRQYVSWVHDEDFVEAIRWLIQHEEIDGAVNVAAPNPLPNAEFMRVLRQAAGVPVGLPANRLMLEIGAVFMRTETELILKSRRVVPRRLLEHGFVFKYPKWHDAAVDLCGRWKLMSPRWIESGVMGSKHAEVEGSCE